MLLLVTQALPQMREHAAPNLGRLVTPRHDNALPDQPRDLAWAADNDCFQGLNAPKWLAMLDRLEHASSRPLFCCVPDVVGDARTTAELFERWAPELERRRLPLALVLQDGAEVERIPWERLAAVFVGGTDAFKFSPVARELVREAKRRELWAHVGRVNGAARMRKAAGMGADSVDGTGWIRWRDANLPRGIQAAAAIAAQATMDTAGDRWA